MTTITALLEILGGMPVEVLALLLGLGALGLAGFCVYVVHVSGRGGR